MASDPQWRLASKDLPSIRWLGKGLSGYVYETTWLGNRYTRKDFPLGSVKRNYVFENEAKSLVDLDHPNIVKYFGYTVGKSSCSLLQEYVDENLQSALEKRIDAQRKMRLSSSISSTSEARILDVDEIKRSISNQAVVGSKTFQSVIPFQLPEAVDIMLQIAEGVKYLHDNEIAHGDLKPNNVLLHYLKPAQMIVKVADYGLVETKKLIKLVPKRSRHFEALMWKAPERLNELLGPLTENSDDPFTDSDTDSDGNTESYELFSKTRLAMADVFSFGLICLHLLGAEPIYPNWSLTQIREERMKYDRLQAPPAIPNNLKVLIVSCLEPQPSKRITFRGIYSMLKELLSKQLPLWSMPLELHSLVYHRMLLLSIYLLQVLSNDMIALMFQGHVLREHTVQDSRNCFT